MTMKRLLTLFLSLVLAVSMVVPADVFAKMTTSNSGTHYNGTMVNGENSTIINDDYYFSYHESAKVKNSAESFLDQFFVTLDEDTNYFEFKFGTNDFGKTFNYLELTVRGLDSIGDYKVEYTRMYDAVPEDYQWYLLAEGSLDRDFDAATIAANKDIAFAYPIIFDTPATQGNRIRFTITSWGTDEKKAQISQAELKTTNGPEFAVRNGTGNDIFNALTNGATAGLYKSTDQGIRRYRSRWIMDYRMSKTSAYANNGGFWPSQSANITSDKEARLMPNSSDKCWYAVDTMASGQMINHVAVRVDTGIVKEYEVFSTNDATAFNDPDSTSWESHGVVNGEFSATSDGAISLYDVDTARYWLIKVNEFQGTLKLKPFGLYTYIPSALDAASVAAHKALDGIIDGATETHLNLADSVDGYTINWESSDASVVNPENGEIGTITGGAQVTLTASVTDGGITRSFSRTIANHKTLKTGGTAEFNNITIPVESGTATEYEVYTSNDASMPSDGSDAWELLTKGTCNVNADDLKISLPFGTDAKHRMIKVRGGFGLELDSAVYEDLDDGDLDSLAVEMREYFNAIDTLPTMSDDAYNIAWSVPAGTDGVDLIENGDTMALEMDDLVEEAELTATVTDAAGTLIQLFKKVILNGKLIIAENIPGGLNHITIPITSGTAKGYEVYVSDETAEPGEDSAAWEPVTMGTCAIGAGNDLEISIPFGTEAKWIKIKLKGTLEHDTKVFDLKDAGGLDSLAAEVCGYSSLAAGLPSVTGDGNYNITWSVNTPDCSVTSDGRYYAIEMADSVTRADLTFAITDPATGKLIQSFTKTIYNGAEATATAAGNTNYLRVPVNAGTVNSYEVYISTTGEEDSWKLITRGVCDVTEADLEISIPMGSGAKHWKLKAKGTTDIELGTLTADSVANSALDAITAEVCRDFGKFENLPSATDDGNYIIEWSVPSSADYRVTSDGTYYNIELSDKANEVEVTVTVREAATGDFVMSYTKSVYNGRIITYTNSGSKNLITIPLVEGTATSYEVYAAGGSKLPAADAADWALITKGTCNVTGSELEISMPAGHNNKYFMIKLKGTSDLDYSGVEFENADPGDLDADVAEAWDYYGDHTNLPVATADGSHSLSWESLTDGVHIKGSGHSRYVDFTYATKGDVTLTITDNTTFAAQTFTKALDCGKPTISRVLVNGTADAKLNDGKYFSYTERMMGKTDFLASGYTALFTTLGQGDVITTEFSAPADVSRFDIWTYGLDKIGSYSLVFKDAGGAVIDTIYGSLKKGVSAPSNEKDIGYSYSILFDTISVCKTMEFTLLDNDTAMVSEVRAAQGKTGANYLEKGLAEAAISGSNFNNTGYTGTRRYASPYVGGYDMSYDSKAYTIPPAGKETDVRGWASYGGWPNTAYQSESAKSYLMPDPDNADLLWWAVDTRAVKQNINHVGLNIVKGTIYEYEVLSTDDINAYKNPFGDKTKDKWVSHGVAKGTFTSANQPEITLYDTADARYWMVRINSYDKSGDTPELYIFDLYSIPKALGEPMSLAAHQVLDGASSGPWVYDSLSLPTETTYGGKTYKIKWTTDSADIIDTTTGLVTMAKAEKEASITARVILSDGTPEESAPYKTFTRRVIIARDDDLLQRDTIIDHGFGGTLGQSFTSVSGSVAIESDGALLTGEAEAVMEIALDRGFVNTAAEIYDFKLRSQPDKSAITLVSSSAELIKVEFEGTDLISGGETVDYTGYRDIRIERYGEIYNVFVKNAEGEYRAVIYRAALPEGSGLIDGVKLSSEAGGTLHADNMLYLAYSDQFLACIKSQFDFPRISSDGEGYVTNSISFINKLGDDAIDFSYDISREDVIASDGSVTATSDAQYVCIKVTGTNASGSFTNVFDLIAGGTNLLLGSTIDADSTTGSGYSAPVMIDGEIDNAYTAPGVKKFVINIDMKANKDFNKLVLFPAKAVMPATGVTLEVSSDKADYTTVYTAQAAETGNIINLGVQNGRYLRLTTTQEMGVANGYREIGLYYEVASGEECQYDLDAFVKAIDFEKGGSAGKTGKFGSAIAVSSSDTDIIKIQSSGTDWKVVVNAPATDASVTVTITATLNGVTKTAAKTINFLGGGDLSGNKPQVPGDDGDSGSGGGGGGFGGGGGGAGALPSNPPVLPGQNQPQGGSAYSELEGHWGKNEILSLINRGIVQGTGDGLALDRNVTRAEFLKMIIAGFGIDLVKYTDAFSDVHSGLWYADYAQTAFDKGIMSGDGMSLRGDDPITRQEMCVALTNALEKLGYIQENKTQNDFADEHHISSWASRAVDFMVQAEIVNGYPTGEFMPLNNLRRDEAMAVIYRALELEIR